MLERALLIARKDLFLRFTDRNLLLMLLVVPLALPVIIALVFGNFGGPAGAPALRDIPLAIVNLDAGAEQQGRELNHGVGLVQLLTGHAQSSATDALSEACPSAPGQSAAAAEGENTLTLDALFAAREMQDVTAGRALVDEGELAALVIIPPDFSARLSPRIGPGAEPLYPTAPVPIEVYSDSSRPLESLVLRSVVAGYSERLLAGNIALGASINSLISQQPLASLRLLASQEDEAVTAAISCGFSDPDVGARSEMRMLVTDDSEPLRLATRILAQIGAAQATFFALFAAQFGVLSVIEERHAGTLGRILTTVTTRATFLVGKLLGTLLTALLQLLLLMLALSLVASLLEGRPLLIWGTNLPALLAILLPLSLAVAGLGTLLVAFVQRPEQLGPLGAIINVVLAMLGGAFGFSVPEPFAWLSLIHWGTSAMARLSAGSADIGLNVLVLTAQGVALFAIGLWFFRRRVEV